MGYLLIWTSHKGGFNTEVEQQSSWWGKYPWALLCQSQLHCKGALQCSSSQPHGQAHHLEEGVPLHGYSQEPTLFVAFPDAFDKLSRLICLLIMQPSSDNFHRTRADNCDFFDLRKGKNCIFKAEEMPTVCFAKVRRSNSSTNTRESQWLGWMLYCIPTEKM